MRYNGFNQERQIVLAAYPPKLAAAIEIFFERIEVTDERVKNHFENLCRIIRDDFSERHATLAKPASEGKGGRLSSEEEILRHDLRRNVYILVREFVGLKWWRNVAPLVVRKTPGQRARSAFTKRYADVLHFVLHDTDAAKPVLLEVAAIGDMANELAYAERHEVPFQFLIGFLSEVGFENAAKKERATEWEAWHPKYLKPRNISADIKVKKSANAIAISDDQMPKSKSKKVSVSPNPKSKAAAGKRRAKKTKS